MNCSRFFQFLFKYFLLQNLVSRSMVLDSGQQNAPKYMSEEHKMTSKDKLVLTATLAIIFFGILGLGLIGLIFNLSG